MRAEQELGAHVRFIEPGEGSDREAGLRLLAAEGMDLVIGVGFIFTDDLTQLAKEYPTYELRRRRLLAVAPTARAIRSRRRRTSRRSSSAKSKARFSSARSPRSTSKSKKVGFVGGMDSPLIQKFEVGLPSRRESSVSRLHGHSSATPASRRRRFAIRARARSSRSASTSRASNVIYHASGSTGLGVFEAARQTGKFAIGVDADQYSEAPGHVLTSMVKGVDDAVFDAIKRVKEHASRAASISSASPRTASATCTTRTTAR